MAPSKPLRHLSVPWLLDILFYKRELPTQLLTVATIFGAFSMSGGVAILIGPNGDRLHRFLFLALSVASLAFIFATALDAVLLPDTARKANLELGPERIRMLGVVDDGVVWAVIFGALALVTAMGGFGFTFSRRQGHVTCKAGGAAGAILSCDFSALTRARS